MSNRASLAQEVLEEFVEAGNRVPRSKPWQWLDADTYTGRPAGPRELPVGDLAQEAEQARQQLAAARTAPLPVRRPHPQGKRGRRPLGLTVEAIRLALEAAGGGRLRAAAALGVSLNTLLKYMRLSGATFASKPLPVPGERRLPHADADCTCGTCRQRHRRQSKANRIRIGRSLVRFFHAVAW